MKTHKFNFEYFLLSLAVVYAIISLSIDLYSTSTTLFSRSGSVMVLLAVFVEYRIANYIYDDIQKAMFFDKKIDISIPLKAKPQKERVMVSRITHLLVIVGTLIWGYGDLFF